MVSARARIAGTRALETRALVPAHCARLVFIATENQQGVRDVCGLNALCTLGLLGHKRFTRHVDRTPSAHAKHVQRVSCGDAHTSALTI
ncbi:hypothetical protein NDU88_001485 [Pleurodeles waltl]|uniref:Uncharacterized protein n=1 Tax=Pleurodeles waltl TaxID=8319 RepID=A0AAV7NCK5_PLEWA|nr:hypothetical protein NDU88_001485 [Pleurodeles waltl]